MIRRTIAPHAATVEIERELRQVEQYAARLREHLRHVEGHCDRLREELLDSEGATRYVAVR